MRDRNQLFVKGEKAAKISAIILLALSICKGAVALISGSVALLADSIHTFADIFSSVAVWVGLKLVQKKPTERFPYGYYKAESFALLAVSLTIIISGVLILMEAITKILEPTIVLFPTLVLIATALSGFISYFLGRYKRSVGRLAGSQSLIVEGQHSLIDVYTSLMVLVGVSFSSIGYPVAEALAGLAIGVYVIKVGLWFAKDAILALMDACLRPERASEMKEIAMGVHGVKGVHAIRLRKSGPVSFGEMHVEMQEDLPLDKAHAISEEVEEKIRKRFQDVESITIHIGISHKEKTKIGIPILEDKGLESMTSPHFGGAKLFAFVDTEKGQITSFFAKINEAANLTRKKGIVAAQFLVDEDVDVVLVGDLGEGPFHRLRENMVQIYHLNEPVKIEDAVRLLSQNKLERMMSPIGEDKSKDAE